MIKQGHNVALAALTVKDLVESAGQDLFAETAKVKAEPVVHGCVADDGGTAI